MTEKSENILARLAGRGEKTGDDDTWSTLAPSQPAHADVDEAELEAATTENGDPDGELSRLCDRISSLVRNRLEDSPQTAQPADAPRPVVVAEEGSPPNEGDEAFMPIEPETLADAQLNEAEVEALILKYLLNRGSATGREIADQVQLPFKLVEELLRQMKADQLVLYRNTASVGDYVHQITDLGRERGRRLYEQCTYFGAAPVSLDDYVASVHRQSLTRLNPTIEDLRHAFDDLLLSKQMLNRLGPAINSGRGLFLYGAPGNGKSSIAERVTRAFGQTVWIPRAIGVDGEILRVYDPQHHEIVPIQRGEGLLDTNRIDRRWVRIRRPTIIVGGELTMDNLEVGINPSTRISEAPLQMKSNCGTLVIDDFGRQRIQIEELLNRWIVPLEKRFDLLNLANGKKIQVPFDQLIIFSTNLEPRDLVDEAFLRRIPYKIEITDPSEDEFRGLFHMMAERMNIEYREDVVDYLIEHHFRAVGRSFRCCHPRDLLLQVQNFCKFQNLPAEMTREYFDYAVQNYFAVM